MKDLIKKIFRMIETLLILTFPVISYILFEYITGNLSKVSIFCTILNIGWFYTVYFIVFALSASTRVTVSISSILFLVIALAETFVMDFRSRPIMLWDIFAFGTAMSVTGSYSFELSQQMKTAIGVVAAMNIFAWIFPIKISGIKKRIANALVFMTIAVSYVSWFYCIAIYQYDLNINMWEITETYEEEGYILTTAISARYLVKKPPHGYGNSKIQQICNKYSEPFTQEGEGTKPVNIICIMNESFAELKVAGDFETNIEYFPFFNSLTENVSKGSLCVPVFGSLTSNSEFEFLTGDTMAMLPANSIAYQFNVKPNTYSLVSTLKAQGYKTVAMHPYPGQNWNRSICYSNMGFDEFYDEEYYAGSHQYRNYISDQADYEKILEQIKNKTSENLFIFNVTMQNHGGYDSLYDNFPQEVYLIGQNEGKYPKADQYFSLMKKSDEALEYLISELKQLEEPTMLVMFGDHQPSVEDEFFDEINKIPASEVPAKDRIMWYKTPYLIWTNYERDDTIHETMSANYLSSEVLKEANLKMSPYNRMLLKLKEELPVIDVVGIFDQDGEYHSWNEAENTSFKYCNSIYEYEMAVYNHSIDRNKYKQLFELK